MVTPASRPVVALEPLFELPGLPRLDLPAPLLAAYGGNFGIAPGKMLANFVASVDGVVALPARGESGRLVSGGNDADRFVMALLRACADAVVIGAGTFRKSSGSFWHAADVYPELGESFASARQQLALAPEPLLVVVTASGVLDSSQPALADALVATSRAAEARVRAALPASTRVVAFAADGVPLTELCRLLRSEGKSRLLSEGGPSLFGELVKAKLLDELFLTSSPRLFGRGAGDGKKSLVDGVALDPSELTLASVRRAGSHLFLRYLLAREAPARGAD